MAAVRSSSCSSSSVGNPLLVKQLNAMPCQFGCGLNGEEQSNESVGVGTLCQQIAAAAAGWMVVSFNGDAKESVYPMRKPRFAL